MTDIGETHEFEFPATITRRERLEFSKHADMQLAELSEIMQAGKLAEITVEAETALILLAARRVDSSITFDQVLDHDDWSLAEPAGEVELTPLDETPEPMPEPTPETPELTSSPT